MDKQLMKTKNNYYRKAKIIFMKYHGDKQLLKENEEYYTYQVDSNSEACWYQELVDKMK